MVFKLNRDVATKAYCGPVAIGLLTGIPISRIEASLRRKRRGGFRDVNGRKLPIRATGCSEVIRALERFGCKTEPRNIRDMSTREFVHDVEHMGTFLIHVTHHFMVCEAGKLYDGRYPDGIPMSVYPGSARLCGAWHVVAPETPKYGPAVEKPKAAKPPRDLKAERMQKVLSDIKRWERKEKLAKTKLKKLRTKLRYYERAKDSARSYPHDPA